MNDRMNTIFGWVLGAGIVALGGSIVSGMYFHPIEGEGYPIEAAEEEGGAQDGPPMAMLLNTGTAEAGEAVFAKCQSCHTINQGGADGIGPNLYGVMGTNIGQHAAGYAYSDALAGKGGTWDFDAMDAWLANPAAFAAGTKMSFAGLSSAEDRANVILYLLANGGGMEIPPMPAEDAAPAEGAEEEAAEGEAPAEGEAAPEAAAAE